MADPKYRNEKNDPYPLYDPVKDGDYYTGPFSPTILLADTPITTKNQSGGAIKIKTAHGNSFIVANEICYEHSEKSGIYDTKRLIAALEASQQTVPDKASHLLISHTIKKNKASVVGSTVHADLLHIKKKNASQHYVKDLAFGSPLHFYIYSPKALKKLKKENLQAAPSQEGAIKAEFNAKS